MFQAVFELFFVAVEVVFYLFYSLLTVLEF